LHHTFHARLDDSGHGSSSDDDSEHGSSSDEGEDDAGAAREAGVEGEQVWKSPISAEPDPGSVAKMLDERYVERPVQDNVLDAAGRKTHARGNVTHREIVTETGEEYYVVTHLGSMLPPDQKHANMLFFFFFIALTFLPSRD